MPLTIAPYVHDDALLCLIGTGHADLVPPGEDAALVGLLAAWRRDVCSAE